MDETESESEFNDAHVAHFFENHTHTRGGMWLLRRQTAFYAHNNSTDDKVMATGLP